MQAVILSKEQYDDLLQKMNEIQHLVKTNKSEPSDVFMDNADFIQLMNISKRTAQTWRDEGVISFSQVGSKIYYRMSDIESLLESRKVKAFKK
jgi:hypothetical protein